MYKIILVVCLLTNILKAQDGGASAAMAVVTMSSSDDTYKNSHSNESPKITNIKKIYVIKTDSRVPNTFADYEGSRYPVYKNTKDQYYIKVNNKKIIFKK